MAQEVAVQDQGGQITTARKAEIFKNEVELMRADIEKMLPGHVEFNRFQGNVINVVATDPYLLQCTKPSLMKAVVDAANTGLSLNKVHREADIIKRGEIARFEPRAIGLMKLARQGAVKKIIAHEIYENDTYDVEYAPNYQLIHKPTPLGKKKGEIIGAYCMWWLADGTMQFEVIDLDRIHRARSASESWKAYERDNTKNKTPWLTDFGEMCRKTAIKAASKYMPLSSEHDAFMKAIGLDDEIDGEFTDVTAQVTAEAASEPKTAAQSQLQALEQRIAVPDDKAPAGGEGGAGPTQTTAQAAEGSQARTSSGSSRRRSATSRQDASQNGSATTASPSEGDPRDQEGAPPSPSADNATSNQKTEPKKGVDPAPGAPLQDLRGDEPAVKIDWKKKAREVYNDLMAVQDIPQYKTFKAKWDATLELMAKESPDWRNRIQADILNKEEWLRG